tara:strand:+ start:231 stop:554 length:324 start_codon:yes stop_codon:yes gene_type:complete
MTPFEQAWNVVKYDHAKKKGSKFKKMKGVHLTLPRGKMKVLQAEDTDYNRGLLVKLLKDGGYEMEYWYDKFEAYPIEVLVDGKSIKKDAKKVTMKFHPELKKAMEKN